MFALYPKVIYPINHVFEVLHRGIQETDFAFQGAIIECLKTDPDGYGGAQFNKVYVRIKVHF